VLQHAAFRAKVERHSLAAHLYVMIPERRQAVRMIRPRVLVVADTDQRLLEQADDGGEDALAGERRPFHVGRHPAANARQRRAELDEMVVLRFITRGAPRGVVAVLLASARVAAGRLNVTVVGRTNPDVRPRRRNRECVDAIERRRVADHATRGGDVRETRPGTAATNARPFVGDVPERRHSGDAQ